MKGSVGLATGLATLVAAFAAHAAAVFVENHSFEVPALAAGTFDTNAPPPPGWIEYGNAIDFGLRTVGVLDPTGTALYPGGAPHGENVGVVFLLDDFGNQTTFAGLEAGMQQTLGATLETSSIYTLTVEVGNLATDPTPPHDAFQFDGFPRYRIDLLAGGQILVSDDDTLLPPEGEFRTSVLQVEIGDGHERAGQSLGIRLVNLNAAPGIEVNFDDVRLDRVAASSGAVPDGDDVPGAPLLLDRAGGSDVTLDWSPSCFATDVDYAVYEGQLGDFTSHAPAGSPTCTTSGATTLTLTPGPGSRYFLVVPQGGAREGSYGVDGTGAPRPPSPSACRPQSVATCR